MIILMADHILLDIIMISHACMLTMKHTTGMTLVSIAD
jgi:hypothetical protein